MTEKTKEILKKHLMQAKADRNYFTNSYLEISIDAPEQERKDTFERHLKYTAI